MATGAYQWAKPHALFGLKVIVAQPVQPIARSILQPGIGGSFNPAIFFASGEQGVWYDPSDFSTMFQDSAGTTPVTAVEQPVGLMLDKSKGLVLGPELVTNGDFSGGTTGWTTGTGWSISGGVASRTNTGVISLLSQTITLVPGSTYRIQFTGTVVSGSITATFGGGTTVTGVSRSTTGAYVEVLVPVSGNVQLRMSASTTFEGSIDNISVRELLGNHAFQATSTSRPVLSARYNLLEKTEQFNDAYWTKEAVTITSDAVTAPNGTQTADTVTVSTSNTAHYLCKFSYLSAATYSFSYVLKYNGSQRYVSLTLFDTAYKGCVFDIQNGVVTFSQSATGSVVDLGNGWYRCTIVATVAAMTVYYDLNLTNSSTTISATYVGNGTDNFHIWGADLRVTNDAAGQPAYQRVNTATDYDTTGFKPYLRFDGTDDWLQTNSINFTATDKMTVFAGVRKLSDAAAGTLAELSSAVSTNPGSFLLRAPRTAAANYMFSGGGTSYVEAASTSNYTAPITSVLTGVGDIAGDSAILRIDGAQAAFSTADQGTGNFGNYPLYIGRRGGTTLPFNGRLYGLIVRGAQSTAQQITSTENWLNQRTGAF